MVIDASRVLWPVSTSHKSIVGYDNVQSEVMRSTVEFVGQINAKQWK